MKKIEFIEKGRISNDNMKTLTGGTTWENCTSAGPACPVVKGDNFKIIANCAHNLYTCGGTMQFCVSGDDLAACAGLPSDPKGVIRPV
jgi:hypothetical protein